MGRQLRNARAGEKKLFVAASTGTTKVTIPNYGVSELSSTVANTYVLGKPETGVEKTLICQTPTSAAVVVRLTTDADVSITLGTTANTRITFNSTRQAVVSLIGVDSTRWAVKSVYPDNVAANTTGTVFGTS